MAKRILVIGSLGFIGSNICNELDKQRYSVKGIDNLFFGYIENSQENNIDHREVCLSELTRLDLNKFDIIVSSFCSNIIYAIDKPIETYKNNVVNAIKCFSKFDGKIIYLSTSSIYGNPCVIPTPETEPESVINAYDTSKYIIEEYLKTRGNYTTLRLSNVYGEYQRPENPYCGVIGRFIDNKLHGYQTIIYGNGKDTRDFSYVGDVVNAVIKTIETKNLDTEINIGTGIETSINDLIKLIEIDHYKLIDKRQIDGINRRCLDISKAKKLLNWEPKISLKEGLLKTIDWINANY
jgi:UDP-glucose 4-epimerase